MKYRMEMKTKIDMRVIIKIKVSDNPKRIQSVVSASVNFTGK